MVPNQSKATVSENKNYINSFSIYPKLTECGAKGTISKIKKHFQDGTISEELPTRSWK